MKTGWERGRKGKAAMTDLWRLLAVANESILPLGLSLLSRE